VTTLTIGDVLNRLQDDFPDITASKIRFLETEGLVEPDRTPGGYRKFTDEDIERLRYVLLAQRDRYLPLAVIREELQRIDAGEDPDPDHPPTPGELAGRSADGTQATSARDGAATPGRTPRAVGTDVHLSGRELAERTGLELAQVRALQEHNLLPAGDVFDGDALLAATAAAGLLAAGLEPRHLRMYRQFADREVSLHAQLVQPILRQRNPQARQRATELLDALAAHGTDLHAALLRRELQDLLRS
jgi:DNA-binding transcriptional MerR regulator